MTSHHSRWMGRCVSAGALAIALISWPARPEGQAPGTQMAAATRPMRITATSRASVLDWDAQIDRQIASGTLKLNKSRPDTVLEGRSHERFDQMYGGVRVYGAQIVRQLDIEGRAVSVFG